MPSSVNEMDRLHTRGINGREGSGGRALTDGEAGVGASERQDVGAGQTQPHSQQQQNATSGERFFSVRWMLERERARSESDDCSSAFAIIPVGEHEEYPCCLSECSTLLRVCHIGGLDVEC